MLECILVSHSCHQVSTSFDFEKNCHVLPTYPFLPFFLVNRTPILPPVCQCAQSQIVVNQLWPSCSPFSRTAAQRGWSVNRCGPKRHKECLLGGGSRNILIFPIKGNSLIPSFCIDHRYDGWNFGSHHKTKRKALESHREVGLESTIKLDFLISKKNECYLSYCV